MRHAGAALLEVCELERAQTAPATLQGNINVWKALTSKHSLPTYPRMWRTNRKQIEKKMSQNIFWPNVTAYQLY